MKDTQTLDGEEWWASEAIDDTDSIVGRLLMLSKSCIELNVSIEDAQQLFDELSLHNDKHNIELETDKWLSFCASLSESAVAEMANAVEIKLKSYVSKHFKSRG